MPPPHSAWSPPGSTPGRRPAVWSSRETVRCGATKVGLCPARQLTGVALPSGSGSSARRRNAPTGASGRPAAAQQQLSSSIPRPTLRKVTQWIEGDHAYRAEVYDLLTEQLVSPSPVIQTDPDLPAEWWVSLRAAIDALGSADHLDRDAVREVYIRRRVPEFTGVVPGEIQWTTAHGDLHWSNVCGPTLVVLDWETWGRAPVGFDAAMLLVHSLLEPATASRVAEVFGEVLDSEAGRLAQLIAVTQILQAADRTPFYTSLAPAARKHLDVLTG